MDWWQSLATLFVVLRVQEGQCGDGLLQYRPQMLRVEPDWLAQSLYITWKDNFPSVSESLFYDIEVLRGERDEVVHHDSVPVRLERVFGFSRWNWTSLIPLECASHTVRVRYRHQQRYGTWSIAEMKRPDTHESVYPIDRVVAVGSSVGFCCILTNRDQVFKEMKYGGEALNVTQISKNSYGAVVHNHPLVSHSQTNVVCLTSTTREGSTIFVGYPPDDQGLVCETRDLASVECHWSTGRHTNLKRKNKTSYRLNGSFCPYQISLNECRLNITMERRENNWTLVAENILGSVELNDRANLYHRVRPHAPRDVVMEKVHNRSASVRWHWGEEVYGTLPLVCQVQLSGSKRTDSNYTGEGLSGLVLRDLLPHNEYGLTLRCGSEKNFWKWSEWTPRLNFTTKEDYPDALDIWIRMDTDTTGRVMWKPLGTDQSHGTIREYQVTWGNLPGEAAIVPPTQHSAPFSLEGNGASRVVTVKARNSAGYSMPSSITVWRPVRSSVVKVSKADGRGDGFDLSWPASDQANCGYAVDWCPALGRCGLNGEWTKVPPGSTGARIRSDNFTAGVKYSLSIYACTSGAFQLLERREGYSKELAPAKTAPGFRARQEGTDIVLSWAETPTESQRGFILGYTITFLPPHIPAVNITDPDVRNYTCRNVPVDNYTYRIVLKSYTAGGEDEGVDLVIELSPVGDKLFWKIMVGIGLITGFLLPTMLFCLWKRKWMKEKFYPVIPKPKLSDEWVTRQGMCIHRTSDENFSPYSWISVTEKPKLNWDQEESGDSGNPLLFKCNGQEPGKDLPCDSSYSSMKTLQAGRPNNNVQIPSPFHFNSLQRSAGGYHPQQAEASSPVSVNSSQFLLQNPVPGQDWSPSASSSQTRFFHMCYIDNPGYFTGNPGPCSLSHPQ